MAGRKFQYHTIILGAGSAGLVVASGLANWGLRLL